MNTVIERTGFDPAQDADNGNRFLTGNGYLGVRGTIGEAGVQQMTAVNLAGIHHQKGQGWEEPLNAPNPLYVAVKGVSLPESADRLTSHRLALDIADGVFTRESTFKADAGEITIRQERFCAMERVHLLAQRVTITATHDCIVTIAFGVDENVWDIHGPHYETLTLTESDGVVALTGETDDHQRSGAAARTAKSRTAASGWRKSRFGRVSRGSWMRSPRCTAPATATNRKHPPLKRQEMPRRMMLCAKNSGRRGQRSGRKRG